MARYRILSLDRGGTRGHLTTGILHRIAAAARGFPGAADLLAETSTGGILALGLAANISLDDLVALYRDHAAEVFDQSWLHELRDIGGLTGPYTTMRT